MNVLLTGSAGGIGTAMCESLPAVGHSLRTFDRVPGSADLVGDIGVPGDLDRAIGDAPAPVDAVVHLAGMPTEAPWPQIRDPNIDGLFQVMEAARRHQIRRVVLASSNHAAGFTERPRKGSDVPADTPVRPDTLYGVSKAFAEALGRYYVDRYAMQVVCLRIGSFQPAPRSARELSTWLSPADCTRLVDACLTVPDVGFAIVWGISANTRRWWSLEEGFRIGYRPQDDSELYADRFADAPQPDPRTDRLGGGFTGPDFGIDEIASS